MPSITTWAITIIRAATLILILFAVNALFPVGTSLFPLTLAIICGSVLGTIGAFSRLTTTGATVGVMLFIFCYQAILFVVQNITPATQGSVFLPDVAELHLNIIFGIVIFCAGLNWLFWRFKHWATVELVGLIFLSVSLLAPHRNYHFNTPQLINTLGWIWRTSELAVLVCIGTALAVLVIVFLYFASVPNRAISNAKPPISEPGHKNRYLSVVAVAGLLTVLFYIISSSIYRNHYLIAASRTANGVGQETSEGLSPLTFSSALGATNQPSALVRLEGDYHENPFTSMLYMREQALSQFNGREFVIAERNVDLDVSNVSPSQPYLNDEDPGLDKRVPLPQSIYLLTEHKLAFAIDFPISISPLKNPNPGRFRAAFQAYSMAPGFSLSELESLPVGDTRWPGWKMDHYLQKHPDPRYQMLASKITEGISSPIKKAQALADYLSQNATYTLQPNHKVEDPSDPVAPFLFGDLRGYCVHFAHATAYMLRAVGIPARIATGYLTDLSQAKDGHILLRMSDRHAWAEVYVASRGWIPFDVQPTHVESHAETQVDMKQLEELMGLLGPPEELLPEEPVESEPGYKEAPPKWIEYLPSPGAAATIPIGALLILVMIKLYLIFGWRIARSSRKRLLAFQRSCFALCHDIGSPRINGETRQEYSRRVADLLGPTVTALAEQVNNVRFADQKAVGPNDLQVLTSQLNQQMARLGIRQKLLRYINPSSVVAFITGRRF